MNERNSMPRPGDVAPPIEAVTAAGRHFSLSDRAGQWVVVFFYPMANTPG